jgi:hypothetical protein
MENIKATSPLIKKVQYLESYKTKHTFKVSFGSDLKNLAQAEINSLKNTILNSFSPST